MAAALPQDLRDHGRQAGQVAGINGHYSVNAQVNRPEQSMRVLSG
jgi:hypothetical protein